MSNALTVSEKNDMVATIDNFVATHNIDEKVMLLGAFVDYIENRDRDRNDSMYITASILYARILDRLDKQDDRMTANMINVAISEYMDRAGIDMDKFR